MSEMCVRDCLAGRSDYYFIALRRYLHLYSYRYAVHNCSLSPDGTDIGGCTTFSERRAAENYYRRSMESKLHTGWIWTSAGDIPLDLETPRWWHWEETGSPPSPTLVIKKRPDAPWDF